MKPEHPVFYGYTEKIIPLKYLGGPLMSVGQPDQATVLARYLGGDANVLSGLMRGADEIANRPFAIEVPGGYTGKGRVVLFSNNPIYRWQNHARVQHGVQRDAELERHGCGARRRAPRVTPAGAAAAQATRTLVKNL